MKICLVEAQAGEKGQSIPTQLSATWFQIEGYSYNALQHKHKKSRRLHM